MGLIVTFFAAIIGLILSAVALSQSKKAGFKNTPAKVGLILGIIFSVGWIVFWIIWGVAFAAIVANCPQDAYGTYVCS